MVVISPIRTVSMETVISCEFFCLRTPANSNFATKKTKRERVNSLVFLQETTERIDMLQRLLHGRLDEYSRSEFYYLKHLKMSNVKKL